MGLRSALDRFADQVREIVPSFDPGARFVPYDEADGGGVPIDRCESPGACRRYDVALTVMPQDDGAAAVTNLRWRATFAVRVLYPLGAESNAQSLYRMIGEDSADIVERLLNPNNWDATVHLIDGVERGGLPTARILGADSAILLSVPLTLIYYEA